MKKNNKKYTLSQLIVIIEANRKLDAALVRKVALGCKLQNDWSAGPLFRILDKLEGK